MPIKDATAEEFKGLWQKLTNQTKKKEQGLHRASEVIQFFDSLDFSMSEHLWDAFFQTMDRLEELGVPDDISAPSLPLFMAITEEDPTNDQCIQFETKWKKSQENDKALNAEMKRISKRTNRLTSKKTEDPGYYPLTLSAIRVDWSDGNKQMLVDQNWKCRTVEEILWLTKRHYERFWPKVAKEFYRRRPYCYGLAEFDDFDPRASMALPPVAKLEQLVGSNKLIVLLDKSWVIRESSSTTNNVVSDHRCFGNICAKEDGTYLLKDFSGTIRDSSDLLKEYKDKRLTIHTVGSGGQVKQNERPHQRVLKTLPELLYLWSKQDQKDSGQYWFSVESPATSMHTASTPTLVAETSSAENDHVRLAASLNRLNVRMSQIPQIYGIEDGSITPTDHGSVDFNMPVPINQDAEPMFSLNTAAESPYLNTNEARSEPSSCATSGWPEGSAAGSNEALEDGVAEVTAISEPPSAAGHAQSRATSVCGSSSDTSAPEDPQLASPSKEDLPTQHSEAVAKTGANVIDSNITATPIAPPEPAPAV